MTDGDCGAHVCLYVVTIVIGPASFAPSIEGGRWDERRYRVAVATRVVVDQAETEPERVRGVLAGRRDPEAWPGA
jgi:hypothetical protein